MPRWVEHNPWTVWKKLSHQSENLVNLNKPILYKIHCIKSLNDCFNRPNSKVFFVDILDYTIVLDYYYKLFLYSTSLSQAYLNMLWTMKRLLQNVNNNTRAGKKITTFFIYYLLHTLYTKYRVSTNCIYSFKRQWSLNE